MEDYHGLINSEGQSEYSMSARKIRGRTCHGYLRIHLIMQPIQLGARSNLSRGILILFRR